ncbi:MAG: poly-beta-1,6-N-acetyl-D-glucosamine biosynthesis protein PgaD [Desulfobacteraceae bacterium]|jgi:poly-beta-1,6-N-acetyl-D-glucosamine biosynthesis protein PgaD
MRRKIVDLDEIIIDKPFHLGFFRRNSERGIAVSGWLVWFFMIRPLLLLAAWSFGLHIFYAQFVKLGGYKNLRIFGYYLLVMAAIYIVLQLWNRYNIYRFRGKERRREEAPVSDKQMAAFYRISGRAVSSLKKEAAINVHFLSDQRIDFQLTADSAQSPIAAVYDPRKGGAGPV